MYTLLYRRSVEKDLRRLPPYIRRAIFGKIAKLADDPRPNGAIKLLGAGALYRIRYTDYRIIYEVQDATVTVLIIKVGHRREIYKDL